MDSYKLFIDGKFVNAKDGKTFTTIDPGSGVTIASVAKAGPSDAEAAIVAARRAFDSGTWSGLAPKDRMAIIQDFADQISLQGIRLAATESIDSGQVINLARCWPFLSRQFLRNLSMAATHQFPWDEEIKASGNIIAPAREYIRREPLGVCVGIVPWNFPMYIAMWKIAPALIMGNTCVIKPPSIDSATTLVLGEILAGLSDIIPPGVVNIVTGSGEVAGNALASHPDVGMISFTGSSEAGKSIMTAAGATIKRLSLELGGKNPFIVMEDDDIDSAV